MRNLLVLFILLTSALNAQFVSSGTTLTIEGYTPDEICACDSVKMTVKWKRIGSIPNSNTVYFTLSYRVFTNSSPGYADVMTRSFAPKDFYGFEKSIDVIDTLYSFYQKVPCDFVRNYGDGSSNSLVFTLTFGPGASAYVRVNDCAAGIDEYNQIKTSGIYYDLYGNNVDFSYNKVLVEKIGNRTKKIFVSN